MNNFHFNYLVKFIIDEHFVFEIKSYDKYLGFLCNDLDGKSVGFLHQSDILSFHKTLEDAFEFQKRQNWFWQISSLFADNMHKKEFNHTNKI